MARQHQNLEDNFRWQTSLLFENRGIMISASLYPRKHELCMALSDMVILAKIIVVINKCVLTIRLKNKVMQFIM